MRGSRDPVLLTISRPLPASRARAVTGRAKLVARHPEDPGSRHGTHPMTRILFFVAFVAQVILFYSVFLAGIVVDPFHQRWFITHPSAVSLRFFNPAGLLLALGAYAVVLLLEAVLGKLRPHAVLTTLALVLALALGFVSHLGFATQDLF